MKLSYHRGHTSDSVYIRDAMAVIQSMKGDQYKTFDDIGRAYLQGLILCFSMGDTVIDVFDRYDHKESVKQSERDKRQACGPAGRQYQVISGRSVPPWRKFLNNHANKAALASFLCQYIIDNTKSHLDQHPTHKIYLAGGFSDGIVTKSLSSGLLQDVSELFCTHEEASTRMVLHAMSANEIYQSRGVQGRIIVSSSDTDVMILFVHYFPQMKNTSEVWMRIGRATSTADKRRYVPIHTISESLGDTFCKILPALHCLTGCDSVSSFFRIGKRTAFKVIEDRGATHYADLQVIGGDDKSAAFEASQRFVIDLYEPKVRQSGKHSTLGEVRANFAKNRDLSLAKLPPSKQTFKQYVLRTMWQAHILDVITHCQARHCVTNRP